MKAEENKKNIELNDEQLDDVTGGKNTNRKIDSWSHEYRRHTFEYVGGILYPFYTPMQLVVPSVVITDVTKLARICKNVIQPFFFIVVLILKLVLRLGFWLEVRASAFRHQPSAICSASAIRHPPSDISPLPSSIFPYSVTSVVSILKYPYNKYIYL